MCRVLKANASSYYHWIRTGCIIEKVDEELNRLIQSIFKTGKEALAKKHGVLVSKRRIGKIMKSLKTRA